MPRYVDGATDGTSDGTGDGSRLGGSCALAAVGCCCCCCSRGSTGEGVKECCCWCCCCCVPPPPPPPPVHDGTGEADSPDGILGGGCGPMMPAWTRDTLESDLEPWRENTCESAMEMLSSQIVTWESARGKVLNDTNHTV